MQPADNLYSSISVCYVTAASTAISRGPGRMLTFLQQPELAGDAVRGLRALGVRVALDDFGMSYSSPVYLTRYPVDALKIDRAFVAGMLDDANAWAVVATIQQLADAMHSGVVAEGIEDEAQFQALQAIGCQLVQDYLLGRPVPGKQMAAALSERYARRPDDTQTPASMTWSAIETF